MPDWLDLLMMCYAPKMVHTWSSEQIYTQGIERVKQFTTKMDFPGLDPHHVQGSDFQVSCLEVLGPFLAAMHPLYFYHNKTGIFDGDEQNIIIFVD